MSTQQIIEIVLNVANAICLIFCFTKMGIDPWAAIIPIYGPWMLYERVWGAGWVALLTLIPVVGLILSMVTYWKMFAGFGKGVLFRIFGIIFQPIAIAICAFDGSSYYG